MVASCYFCSKLPIFKFQRELTNVQVIWITPHTPCSHCLSCSGFSRFSNIPFLSLLTSKESPSFCPGQPSRLCTQCSPGLFGYPSLGMEPRVSEYQVKMCHVLYEERATFSILPALLLLIVFNVCRPFCYKSHRAAFREDILKG